MSSDTATEIDSYIDAAMAVGLISGDPRFPRLAHPTIQEGVRTTNIDFINAVNRVERELTRFRGILHDSSYLVQMIEDMRGRERSRTSPEYRALADAFETSLEDIRRERSRGCCIL